MELNELDDVDWVGCETNQHGELMCTVQVGEESKVGGKRGTIKVDRIKFKPSESAGCAYGERKSGEKEIICQS